MTINWEYWAPIWDGDFADFRDMEDAYNILMAIFCVICAGLAAGLTMGLMSLDRTKVELKTITGSIIEKKHAETVLPIIKRHHFLLVTLLLFNSLANESLPIFLGALFPNWLAILISVTAVLVFGEIIPSALFTGPVQLSMAARFSPLVIFLMTIFWPVAYPLGKILDYTFGHDEDSSLISREDFEAMVMLQRMVVTTSNTTSISNTASNTNNSSRGSARNIASHSESSNAHTHLNATVNMATSSSSKNSNNNTNTATTTTTNNNCINTKNHDYGALSTTDSIDSHHHDHHDIDKDLSSSSFSHSSSLFKPIDKETHVTTNANGASTLVPTSRSSQNQQTRNNNKLSNDELSILAGVLRLSKKTVKDVMINISKVCMLSDAAPLNQDTLDAILRTGYSRLPVFKNLSRQQIRGYLLVKTLIVIDPNIIETIGQQNLREPLFLRPDVSILEALSIFRHSRCHIAMICDDPMRAIRVMRSNAFIAYEPKILGIVTMEDCIEEIIQEKIMDETDMDALINNNYHTSSGSGGGNMNSNSSSTSTGGSTFHPLFQNIHLSNRTSSSLSSSLSPNNPVRIRTVSSATLTNTNMSGTSGGSHGNSATQQQQQTVVLRTYSHDTGSSSVVLLPLSSSSPLLSSSFSSSSSSSSGHYQQPNSSGQLNKSLTFLSEVDEEGYSLSNMNMKRPLI